MRRLALAAALGAALVACGTAGAPRARSAPHEAKASRAELERFLGDENRLLALVASTDARVVARGVAEDDATLEHAAMGAILAEDTTLVMEPGPPDRPDLFSFAARGRALDGAAAILARWQTPPADPDPASTLEPGLEVELLGRFVASEKLRLADERGLPRSASTLLGAIAATWRTPGPLQSGKGPDMKALAARDEWLARRLGEVTQSLAPRSLTGLEREELEDALDPLEHAVGDALPKSRQALLDVRLAVQNLDPAPKGPDRWAAVSARLAADTGTRLSPDTLLALFAQEARLVRGEIDKLVGVEVTDDVVSRAAGLLLAPPEACRAANFASRMRALQPPPERSLGCALRARVAAAQSSAEMLGVLVAMHEAIVTAAHALVFARGGDDAAVALAAPKAIAPMSPTDEGRLDRFAAVHPVEAIARALSIEWLMRGGMAEAALRARAWSAFGDAPLDVIDRELHPHPREKSHLRQSTLH
jgi:hypothetical protein